ncbi:MAG: thiolase family protein [Acidimicrobiia bacterium]
MVGVGYSQVGRRLGLSLEELSVQSSIAAMNDCGLKPADIDGVAVHSFMHQHTSSTGLADALGIPDLQWHSGTVDGSAYAVAALHGIAAVASGSCETCLTVRTVHQVGSTPASQPIAEHGVSGVEQYLAPFGAVAPPHWAAFYMQRHIEEYGTTPEQFGAFAIAQRDYATQNPEALFRTPLTMDDYLNARYISKPLRLLDCDYTIDSSSALIFTTEERARDLPHRPVIFESWAMGTTPTVDFNLVPSMTHSAPWAAAKHMWARTDLRASDVNVAGLYDGFTFISLQWLEALGFCGEGESGPFVEEGNTRPGGAIPTNTDGGACNVGRRHGANFFIEVTRQLRGDCGPRQIPGAEVGVVSNSVGGFAACALMTVA